MRKLLIFIFLSTSIVLPGFSAKVELKAGYFMPSEKAFRDVYGSGPIAGAEIEFKLFGPLNLYIEGNYFNKNGKLTYTLENTRLMIIPAGAGLRVNINRGGITKYIGCSVRYYRYYESNPIGSVNASSAGVGGNVGGHFRINKWLCLDLRLSYFYCKMKPVFFEFNIGGIELGGGLVLNF